MSTEISAVLTESKEGAGSFGAGVTGGWESPNVGAENLNC